MMLQLIFSSNWIVYSLISFISPKVNAGGLNEHRVVEVDCLVVVAMVVWLDIVMVMR